MSLEDDDLNERERRAYAELPRERAPRADLEDAIVRQLRERGQIVAVRPARRVLTVAAVAASILLAFGIGLSIGRSTRSAAAQATPPGSRFVLVMYGDARFKDAERGHESERAAEYIAWARSVRGGRIIGGNELADASRVLGPQGAQNDRQVRGYFVLAAADERAAATIAETCPHLKYGGTIAIQAIIEH